MVTKRVFFVLMIVFTVLLVAPVATSSGQSEPDVTVSLTAYESNPVLALGEPGTWDSGGIFEPRVFYLDGLFHMLYLGWREEDIRRSGLGYVIPETSSLGYATSEDGFHWTKYEGNPVFVLDKSYSSCGLLNQTTVMDADTWIMYLTPCEDPEKVASTTLLRATAPTLSGPWTVDQTLTLPAGVAPDWDRDGYTVHSVFHTDAGYILYFGTNTARSPMGIGRATSADAVTWTKHNDPENDSQDLYKNSDPVLGVAGSPGWDVMLIFAPVVLQDELGWQMFYGGGRGGPHTSIGFATSEDGITWERVGDAPVLDISGWGVWPSSAVVLDDTYYVYFSMWESESGGTLSWSVGVATGTVTHE